MDVQIPEDGKALKICTEVWYIIIKYKYAARNGGVTS